MKRFVPLFSFVAVGAYVLVFHPTGKQIVLAVIGGAIVMVAFLLYAARRGNFHWLLR